MFRRSLNSAIIISGILFLLGTAIEVVCCVILDRLPIYDERMDFRGKRPLPYLRATYFSKNFLTESAKAQGSGVFDENVRRLIDFDGEQIKIRNGLRNTTDRPPATTQSVFLFGGSTVFSSEVPDNLTIASYLQREINTISTRYSVVNVGISSMNASQEFCRLRETDVNKGDIVIFLDGVNDVIYNVYYGYPKGLNKNSPIFHQSKNLLNDRIVPALHFCRLVSFSRLLLRLNRMSVPANMRSKEEVKQRAQSAGNNYRDTLTKANEFCRLKGAIFLHFLQPNLFTVSEKTEYEKSLIRNYHLTPPGLENAFTLTYPELIAQTRALRQSGINSYDLSGTLDDRTQEIFLDFCHTNEYANSKIATCIFHQLIQEAG